MMMNSMTWFAVGILSVWFVLSFVAQLSERTLRALRRYDFLGVIPVYNFFAPTPGTLDYHLLVRDQSPDGALTPWRELPYSPRTPYDFVWNPGRRYNKALFDVMKDLSTWIHELNGEKDPLYLSPPYIAVLNHVSALPRTDPVARTQFMLMSSKRQAKGTKIAPVFLSSLHPLG